jgi:hypothetical protein
MQASFYLLRISYKKLEGGWFTNESCFDANLEAFAEQVPKTCIGILRILRMASKCHIPPSSCASSLAPILQTRKENFPADGNHQKGAM